MISMINRSAGNQQHEKITSEFRHASNQSRWYDNNGDNNGDNIDIKKNSLLIYRHKLIEIESKKY